MAENVFGRAKKFIFDYFSFNGYLVTQSDAELSIREGVSFRGTNIVILIMAILIASLGLNTNSTAVIIGAMLISPLMGPIIGIGLGIGIMDFGLLKQALRSLAMATAISVLASTVYFLISPVGQGHSELLARTSPTIYDVLIGFVGGGAGIVAICSKNKGNVIPGVAIATALMPPLCTAGYGLATWQLNYFFGAFYLFLINSIFIGLSTFIGVKMFKFKPVDVVDVDRARKVRRVVYIVALLTLLPSIYLTWSMLRQSRFDINAGRFVSEQCVFPSTHVLATNTSWHRGHGTINITLIGKVLPQDSLQMALMSKLQFYGLQGSTLNILQGDSPGNLNPQDMMGNSVRDIYEMSQTLLASKQTTIDSLRAVLAFSHAADTVSGAIAPELKVLFPQIQDMAISRAVFAETETSALDTVDMALVTLNRPLPAAKRNELSRYLEARLKLKSLKIVDVGAVR